jgi:hypothetical protein
MWDGTTYARARYRSDPDFRRSVNDRNARARNRRRAWIDDLRSVPCADCGHTFPPVAMDFHHRDPASKSFEIGPKRFSYSKAKLLDEIAKCDVICSNCHRIRHHIERTTT